VGELASFRVQVETTHSQPTDLSSSRSPRPGKPGGDRQGQGQGQRHYLDRDGRHHRRRFAARRAAARRSWCGGNLFDAKALVILTSATLRTEETFDLSARSG